MAYAPVVALDIGTSKVCALVGEIREDGNVMIIGMGASQSAGIRKGVVLDLDVVSRCVKAAVELAEESSSVDIRQVYMTVTGGHIQSLVNPGTVPVFDSRRGITKEDVEEVTEIAEAVSLPHDRDMLHCIPQKFVIDDHYEVINPEGMTGSKLSLNMLIVHGARNLLNNAAKAASSAGLGILDAMCDCLCSGLAVLTPEQRNHGVLLIDIGAGTSSYAVFEDDIIAAMGVLGVGGDHITNDIMLAFNISSKRAELLKKESGSAMLETGEHFKQIHVPAELGFIGCSVLHSDLNVVINARVVELFSLIKSDLESKRAIGRLAAGIVLTGGGVHLKNIETVAGAVFDLPCAIGRPRNFSGMASVYEGPEYAAALGLIRHGARKAERGRHSAFGGWVRELFGLRG